MTETTKTIFEKYEVRKTKKQKTAFIEYVRSVADERGYTCSVEKGSFGARNIVIGSPEKAKVIYTAHYDTCPVLPFPNFITPKNIFWYLLYQIVLTFAILISAGLVCVGLGILLSPVITNPLIGLLIVEAPIVALLVLLLAGPANKHTANDNTSGVTTLLDIMCALPEEDREDVAFIFFDLEETGLIGSSSFAGKHKNIKNNKLLVNFDCVSDGENILFVLNKKTAHLVPAFEESFAPNGNVKVEIATKGVFYPSDQACFKMGVGVAALKHSKIFGLYMDRIHTPRDTVYREENIAFLVEGAIKLAEKLSEK